VFLGPRGRFGLGLLEGDGGDVDCAVVDGVGSEDLFDGAGFGSFGLGVGLAFDGVGELAGGCGVAFDFGESQLVESEVEAVCRILVEVAGKRCRCQEELLDKIAVFLVVRFRHGEPGGYDLRRLLTQKGSLGG
jgi:hypothetical protein